MRVLSIGGQTLSTSIPIHIEVGTLVSLDGGRTWEKMFPQDRVVFSFLLFIERCGRTRFTITERLNIVASNMRGENLGEYIDDCVLSRTKHMRWGEANRLLDIKIEEASHTFGHLDGARFIDCLPYWSYKDVAGWELEISCPASAHEVTEFYKSPFGHFFEGDNEGLLEILSGELACA